MAKRLIDPIYKKYASRVISAVASTDFYDYFMEVIGAGKNTYQFSNRHVEKSVDERWVIAVEDCIKPMEEIINNPRNFIMTEEAIVNVALAKKVTPDSIKHLAQHGDMIDSVTENSVKPNRLMEKFKEDSWNTYENRFVYTLLDMAWDFVDKRYDAIFQALGDECGSHLRMSSDARSLNEHIKAEVDIRIQEDEDLLSADEKSESIFARIARCHRILTTYKSSSFAKAMAKFGKIKPPLFPTNAIKKNPNFKACHRLWNFILSYNDIGYKIDIFEQSNEISEEFETDIKHSIMFDYIILKNYLQIKGDRLIDTTRAFKKKAMRPTYVREIIEEIVKNYDLPDVEVRKVLIEEIDKAQLLKLEEAERLRLVAEKEKEMKAKRLAEEKEARKKARAEEREKLRQEKERLKELERQERRKEAEEKRLERQEEKRLEEEALWIEKIRGEIGRFDEYMDLKRNRSAIEAEQAKKAAKERLEREAVRAKKQEELRKQKEKERALKEKEKEKARAKAEKEKAKAQEKAEKNKQKAKEKAEAEELKARAAAGRTRIHTVVMPEAEPEEILKAAAAAIPAAEEEKKPAAKKPAKETAKKPAAKKAAAEPAAETVEAASEKEETKKAEPKKPAAKKPAEKKPAEKKETAEKPAESKEQPKQTAEQQEARKPEGPKAEPEKDIAAAAVTPEAPAAPEAPPIAPNMGFPGDYNTFDDPKPIGVTEMEQLPEEKKGIRSIFRKLFR